MYFPISMLINVIKIYIKLTFNLYVKSLENTFLLFFLFLTRYKLSCILFFKIFDSAKSCPRPRSDLREFFGKRKRNRQIKHTWCFFSELKFVSRDSSCFAFIVDRIPILFFVLSFSSPCPAPAGLSKRLLPREKTR